MKDNDLLHETIYKLQEKMLLSHWQINTYISEVDCEDNPEADAKCDTEIDYLTAELTLYPRFFKVSKPEQRQTLIHEMIHMILAEYKQKMIMAKNGLQIFDSEINRLDEQAVSHLERIISL